MNADTQQRILDAVDAGFDAQLATTADFVAIPSTRGAEGPCQDMIGDLLRRRGYEVDDWHLDLDDLKDLRGYGPDTGLCARTTAPAFTNAASTRRRACRAASSAWEPLVEAKIRVGARGA